jgi:hypothetical protein
LFEEVKALVAQLDEAEADSPEITHVHSLRHTNSMAMQQALSSILGNVTSSSAESSGDSRRRDDDDDDDSPEERARRAMRRNMEMIQDLRRMQERMGGGDRDGGDRSRFFQNRGGFGGFPGRGGDGDRGGDNDRGGRD